MIAGPPAPDRLSDLPACGAAATFSTVVPSWTGGHDDHLVNPVLVVEGSGLWLYESRQEPRLVPRARLVWWGAPAGQSAAIVDVVSRTEFAPPYLLDLRDRLVTLGASISGTAPTAGPFAMFG